MMRMMMMMMMVMMLMMLMMMMMMLMMVMLMMLMVMRWGESRWCTSAISATACVQDRASMPYQYEDEEGVAPTQKGCLDKDQADPSTHC
eukprot:10142885-Karenia_brevis.AAC.1